MKIKPILLKTIPIAILSFGGFCMPLIAGESARHTFAIGTNDFLLDGQRFQIRCGAIHAARVPAEYWRHRLQMAKAMGLNTVCTYLFWNQIEPRPGGFDWSGQADVAEFCRIAQSEGLWVILRPGPHSCAEWEMGGRPWWLLKNDDIQLRTRDPRYLDQWRASVEQRLAQLDKLYSVFHTEVNEQRILWLEAIIVIFFAIDLLILVFVRR
jgi:beta-galactosidase